MPLSFDYGQRHRVELAAAARVAALFEAREHRVMTIDLRRLRSERPHGALDVPKHAAVADIEEGIPITYCPGAQHNFSFLRDGLGGSARNAPTFLSA